MVGWWGGGVGVEWKGVVGWWVGGLVGWWVAGLLGWWVGGGAVLGCLKDIEAGTRTTCGR